MLTLVNSFLFLPDDMFSYENILFALDYAFASRMQPHMWDIT